MLNVEYASVLHYRANVLQLHIESAHNSPETIDWNEKTFLKYEIISLWTNPFICFNSVARPFHSHWKKSIFTFLFFRFTLSKRCEYIFPFCNPLWPLFPFFPIFRSFSSFFFFFFCGSIVLHPNKSHIVVALQVVILKIWFNAIMYP